MYFQYGLIEELSSSFLPTANGHAVSLQFTVFKNHLNTINLNASITNRSLTKIFNTTVAVAVSHIIKQVNKYLKLTANAVSTFIQLKSHLLSFVSKASVSFASDLYQINKTFLAGVTAKNTYTKSLSKLVGFFNVTATVSDTKQLGKSFLNHVTASLFAPLYQINKYFTFTVNAIAAVVTGSARIFFEVLTFIVNVTGSSITWDSTQVGTGASLDSTKLTCSVINNGVGGYAGTRALVSRSTGNGYFELFVTSAADPTLGSWTAGLGNASAGVGPPEDPGFDLVTVITAENGWYLNGGPLTPSSVAPPIVGHWMGFAVNSDAKLLWNVDVTAAPTVWNDGSGNPAAGTGGFNISAISGALYPMWWGYTAAPDGTGISSATANFGSSPFAGTLPAGFVPWNQTGAVTVTKQVDKYLNSVVTGITTLARSSSKLITTAVSATTQIIKNLSKTVMMHANATITALNQKVFLRTYTANIKATITYLYSNQKNIQSTVVAVASYIKQIQKSISINIKASLLSPLYQLSKNVLAKIIATSFYSRSIVKSLTGSAIATTSVFPQKTLIKSYTAYITAVANRSVSINKQFVNSCIVTFKKAQLLLSHSLATFVNVINLTSTHQSILQTITTTVFALNSLSKMLSTTKSAMVKGAASSSRSIQRLISTSAKLVASEARNLAKTVVGTVSAFVTNTNYIMKTIIDYIEVQAIVERDLFKAFIAHCQATIHYTSTIPRNVTIVAITSVVSSLTSSVTRLLATIVSRMNPFSSFSGHGTDVNPVTSSKSKNSSISSRGIDNSTIRGVINRISSIITGKLN